MEYNRVTAILLILLSSASAISMAGSTPTGSMSMFLAIVATMATVGGAGLAWTKGSPWVVLGLIIAAATSTGLSVAASYKEAGAMVQEMPVASYKEVGGMVQEMPATT